MTAEAPPADGGARRPEPGRARRRRVREADDRSSECLVISDGADATDSSTHDAALYTVTRRGGVVGAVATSDAVLAATERAA